MDSTSVVMMSINFKSIILKDYTKLIVNNDEIPGKHRDFINRLKNFSTFFIL